MNYPKIILFLALSIGLSWLGLQITDFFTDPDSDTMREGFSNIKNNEFVNEVMMYGHVLKHLQGAYIPKLHKVRFAPLSLWQCIVVEDCGHRFTSFTSAKITLQHAKDMFECLNKLHESNVLHGDVALRNFVTVDSNVRIIDFARAQFIPEGLDHGDRLCEMQWLADELKDKLDPDEITQLVSKYTKRKRRRLNNVLVSCCWC